MVTWAFARKTLVLVHPGCHRCVWFISDHFVIAAGAQGKLCWRKAHLSLLLGGHVETTMCVYGEIPQCTCTWQCQLLLECDR